MEARQPSETDPSSPDYGQVELEIDPDNAIRPDSIGVRSARVLLSDDYDHLQKEAFNACS
jgi:hypothetical protein